MCACLSAPHSLTPHTPHAPPFPLPSPPCLFVCSQKTNKKMPKRQVDLFMHLRQLDRDRPIANHLTCVVAPVWLNFANALTAFFHRSIVLCICHHSHPALLPAFQCVPPCVPAAAAAPQERATHSTAGAHPGAWCQDCTLRAHRTRRQSSSPPSRPQGAAIVAVIVCVRDQESRVCACVCP